jgi:hypothetical protein
VNPAKKLVNVYACLSLVATIPSLCFSLSNFLPAHPTPPVANTLGTHAHQKKTHTQQLDDPWNRGGGARSLHVVDLCLCGLVLGIATAALKAARRGRPWLRLLTRLKPHVEDALGHDSPLGLLTKFFVRRWKTELQNRRKQPSRNRRSRIGRLAEQLLRCAIRIHPRGNR